MNNESTSKYRGADVTGRRISWHRGEFLTIEKSPRSILIVWSTDVNLSDLPSQLGKIPADAQVDFETSSQREGRRLPRQSSWSEFVGELRSGESHIASVNVELPDYEISWGEPNPAREERYPTLAVVFKGVAANRAAADLVEATGTADVKSRGRQALLSALRLA